MSIAVPHENIRINYHACVCGMYCPCFFIKLAYFCDPHPLLKLKAVNKKK